MLGITLSERLACLVCISITTQQDGMVGIRSGERGAVHELAEPACAPLLQVHSLYGMS